MHNPFLIEKKLYLRSLEESDLEGDYLKWLNNPEVTKFMTSSSFPYTKEKLEEYYESMAKSNDNVFLAIIDIETDIHIGNIRLGPMNWVDRVADLVIEMIEESKRGKSSGA